MFIAHTQHNYAHLRQTIAHPSHWKIYSAPQHKIIMLIVWLWLLPISICQAGCYDSIGSVSTCKLCWDSNQNVYSCASTSPSVTPSTCLSACCIMNYRVSTPDNCIKGNSNSSSSSSLSLATILIIIFFSIPVLICLIMVIHSCLVNRNNTAAEIRRRRRDQPPQSAVNLEDHNLNDQYPYQIDAKQACSICLQDQCTLLTHCGHTYHIQCLLAWVKKKQNCPLCVGRQINPTAVYCVTCLRSVKMNIIKSKMNQEQIAQWELNCTLKCTNCQNPVEDGDQILLSLEDQEVQKYQQPKLPLPDTKKEIIPSHSIQKLQSLGTL